LSFRIVRYTDAEQSTSFRGTRVTKLGCYGGMEIRRYEMSKGSILSIDGTKGSGNLRTYAVNSGSCLVVETGEFLGQGDILLVGTRAEYLNLLFQADTVLSFQGLGVNDFHETANDLENLGESMRRIQDKDAYTESHCKRVLSLVAALAASLGIGGDRFARLTRAARYHDIGKVHIEDHILNKPSALTDGERARMREHVYLGGELVKCSFGPLVYNVMVEHHERLDGSGYPLGLKGDAISEDGRILAICDSFDAMTTDRPYRAALPVEEALRILESEAGTHYDPVFTAAFVRMARSDSGGMDNQGS